MSGKALTNKDAGKILKENGFELLRKKGDHLIYGHSDGRKIVITNGKPLSMKTWKRECKNNNIIY